MEDATAWHTSPGDPDHRSGAPHPGPAGPTDAQAVEAYTLSVRGWTTRAIGAELGIPQTTVRRWVARGRELEHDGEGDVPGKLRRRWARQDADARLRDLAERIEADVKVGRLARVDGYRYLLAVHDRRARLEGTDAPRRAAVSAKVHRSSPARIDPDVLAALAALDRDELYDAGADLRA